MPLLALTLDDVVDIALAVFLLAIGLSFAYAAVRLGGTFGRLSAFIKGAQDEVLPVINKSGGTIDRVNAQLDKADLVTTSAVDAADSVDTAVRAVSMAIQAPVTKMAGLAAGLSHGFSALKVEKDWGRAVAHGREAKARREQDLADELRRAGGEP